MQGSELEKLRKERDALLAEKVRRRTTSGPKAAPADPRGFRRTSTRSESRSSTLDSTCSRRRSSTEARTGRSRPGDGSATRSEPACRTRCGTRPRSLCLYSCTCIHLPFTQLLLTSRSTRTRKIVKDMIAEGVVRDEKELSAFVRIADGSKSLFTDTELMV